MLRTIAAAAAFFVAAASSAFAVTPTFQFFEELPGATFGGSGIPNDPAAWSQFTADNGDVLTLGLIATQRFFNPALSNDGAGTYGAGVGANTGGPGSTSSLTGALWNFNWYADISGAGGSVLEDFEVKLLYDLDPAAGNVLADLGEIDISGLLTGTGFTTSQSSQNLLFNYLTAGVPGVTPPVGGSFDPNAAGEYSFALTSSLGSVAMNVNVVPLPAGAPLLIGAFGVWALVVRRRKAAA